MTIGTIYVIGLAAMYLNGLLTFHLMPVLQRTGHPNLYAMLIFPLTGFVVLLALLVVYALARGLRLSGEAGVLHAQARPVATVFALVAAVSASFAGYGMPTGPVVLVSVLAFALTFFIAAMVLK